MGTSTSSAGPGGGVSLDPPWLDALEGDIASGGSAAPDGADGDDNGEAIDPAGGTVAPPVQISVPRRFANARRSLGIFARSGDRDALRRALGEYSRTGMRGSAQAANRMRVSASAGAALVSMLNGARSGTDPAAAQWLQGLLDQNLSSDDVASAIIERLGLPGALMATSNSPTYGHPNSPRQDSRIMSPRRC
jgi:hypothetical protein